MIDPIGALDRGKHRGILREQLATAGDALVADQDVEIVPGRFVELRLGVEQIHDAQIRRQPGGVVLEGVAANAAPLGRWHQSRDAVAEIGGGGADRVRRHQRMARRAGLPAPLARAGCRCRRHRRRNRWRGGGLKHPGQPIVFRQSLRRRRVGKRDGDQQGGNTTQDGLKDSHEQSRLPAASILRCEVRHLLCYGIDFPVCLNHKLAASRVRSCPKHRLPVSRPVCRRVAALAFNVITPGDLCHAGPRA